MIVIGLTGGIASGKSHVAGLLAERGAVVLDADQHAREVADLPEVREALVERWGDSVLDADGRLDRGAVAGRVFGADEASAADRAFLERLIHPRVRERLREGLEQSRRAGVPAAVLDVPLLIEAGWADECDAVLFVDTPEPIRQARAAERGWSADELARREAAQVPLPEKRAAADTVIPAGEQASAARAVEALWKRLVGEAGGGRPPRSGG